MVNLSKEFVEDLGVKVDSSMASKLQTFAYDAANIEWYIEWVCK